MCTRDKQTATEMSVADVLSSKKKLRKTSGEWGGGGGQPLPPFPRLVRPRVNLNAYKWALLSIIIFYWT